MKRLGILFSGCLFLFCIFDNPAMAQEPGWLPVVIATGDLRSEIQSTPIHLRPYRPLHFYGNAVRRQHYRGTVLPWPFSSGPGTPRPLPVNLLPSGNGTAAGTILGGR